MCGDCFFCIENRFILNEKLGLEGKKSIIYENKNVFVTPDIAPLICGHFLIVSKKHKNSFANTDESVYQSLKEAKEFLKKKLFKEKKLLFFEHGAVVEGTAGACIDHAHMHVIPYELNLDLDHYIKKSGFVNSDKIKAEFKTLQNFALQKQPYLYYEMDTDNGWAYPVGKLPSQFFRAMIAYHLSKEYNWKLTYKTEESKKLFIETLKLANEVNDKKILFDIGEKAVVKDVIYNLFPNLRDRHDDATIINIGDSNEIVVSTDPCPEPIINLYDMSNKYYAYGWMSVLINYSDMAAMGAEPIGILLSTIMPNNMTIKQYKQFLEGVKFACQKWGGDLLGGNIKDGKEFAVTGTVLGVRRKGKNFLKRIGMNVGDVVCVVGDMGMFWLAVLQLKDNKKLDDLDEYTRSFIESPVPKVKESKILAENGNITSCMDSSDGVIGCLYEMAELNNKTICIKNESLKPNTQLLDYCLKNRIDYRNLMLSWGGWELVFTCPAYIAENLKGIYEELNSNFQVIGTVEEKRNNFVELEDEKEKFYIEDFSSKRFDSNSYFSFGIDEYISILKNTHIISIL